MTFTLRSFVVVLGAGSAAACVNARDEYRDFNDRLPDAAPPIDAMIVSELPDITGEWLVTARANLSEKRLVTFRATVVFTATSVNTGEIDWSGQPLDFETLEQVGDPFVESDIVVNNDASADIPFVGTLPPRANSITETQANCDGTIHASVRTVDFVCGDLTGSAGGLPLEGSTFAAVRITGDTLPPRVWTCEDQPQ